MVASIPSQLVFLTSTVFCIILSTQARTFIGECSYGFCEQGCKQFEKQKLQCYCREGYLLKPDGRRCLKTAKPEVRTGGSGDDEGSGDGKVQVNNCDNEDGECDRALVKVPQYSGAGVDDEDDGSGGAETIAVPFVPDYKNPILNNIPHIVSVAFHYPKSSCSSKLETNPYQFRNNLQSEIISVTSLSADSVTEFKISCQSIVVRFKVEPSKERSVTSAVRRIRDLVTAGKLNIKLDGKPVRAIRSSFKSVRDPTYPFNENLLPKPIPKPSTSTKPKLILISSSTTISSAKPSSTQSTIVTKTNLQTVVSTRVATGKPKPSAVDTAKPSTSVVLKVDTPKPSTVVRAKPPTVITPKPFTEVAKKKPTMQSSTTVQVSIIAKEDIVPGLVTSVVDSTIPPTMLPTIILHPEEVKPATSSPPPFSTDIISTALKKIQPAATSETTSKTTSEITSVTTSEVTSTSLKELVPASSMPTTPLASVVFIIKDGEPSSSTPLLVMSASLNTQTVAHLMSTRDSSSSPVSVFTPMHPGPAIPVSSIVAGLDSSSKLTTSRLFITQRTQYAITESSSILVDGDSTPVPLIPLIKEPKSSRATPPIVTPTKVSSEEAASTRLTGGTTWSVGGGVEDVDVVQKSKLKKITVSTKHVKITVQSSLNVDKSTLLKIQEKFTPVKTISDTKSTFIKTRADKAAFSSQIHPPALSSTEKPGPTVVTTVGKPARELSSSMIKQRPKLTSSSKIELKIPWSRVVEPTAASTVELEPSSTVEVGSGTQRTTQVFIPSSHVQPSMRMRISITTEVSSTTRTKTTPLHDVIVTSRTSRPSVLAHDSSLVVSQPELRTSMEGIQPSSSSATVVETEGDFEVKVVIQKSFGDDGTNGGGGSRGCALVANSFILLFLSSLLSYLFVL